MRHRARLLDADAGTDGGRGIRRHRRGLYFCPSPPRPSRRSPPPGGRAEDDLAYVYLCGGLLTFVTLPLVGRCADRFGKRRVFRLMAGCTLVTILVLTNLSAASLFPLLAITTLYWIFTSGRWVPAMA